MIYLNKKKGFTLVELLVALSVSSIVLAAVATLAYAFGRARESMGDVSRTQAYVRYATMRISDLVRYSKMVCYYDSSSFAVWASDGNDVGQINVNELVYVDKGDDSDVLRLCRFSSTTNPTVDLSAIGSLASNWWTAYSATASYTVLVQDCSNVQFGYLYLPPPQSKFVSVSFELMENGAARQFEVSARLRGSAANLLNDAGDGIVSDDD